MLFAPPPFDQKLLSTRIQHNFMISSCFSLFLLAASASAHIKLQSPTPRDTTEDLELNQLSGPCGKGFDKSGSRTTVQLTGFSLNLQVADDKANTVVFGAIGDNPSSFPTQLATSTASLQNVNIPIDFSKVLSSVFYL